jgi:hypothetical protein
VPAFILEAVTEGADTNWPTVVGGGTKTSSIQRPDDDATTYITSTAGDGDQQSYSVRYMEFVSVSSIDMTGRIRHANANPGGVIKLYVYLAGNRTGGASRSPSDTWTTYTDSGLARPGGGSWAPADISLVQAGVVGTTNNAIKAWCTTLYLTVNGDLHGGGYAFPDGIGSILLPLVGAGLLLSQMPAVAGEFNRRAVDVRAPYRLSPADHEPAWRALREHRFPQHYILGGDACRTSSIHSPRPLAGESGVNNRETPGHTSGASMP